MTHEDFCRIELTANKAMKAIGQFADRATRADLNRAAYILAECRHAALYLTDPSDEFREQAAKRLIELFSTDF